MVVLLGDSILKRLYARYPSCYDPLSTKLCESGCGTQTLKALVKSVALGGTVVLLIGINDLLRRHAVNDVWKLYSSLVKTLARKGCIVFCGLLLPLAHPRYASLMPNVRKLNFLIRSMARPPCVYVMDFYSLFILPDGTPNKDLYCATTSRGVDYVHPNAHGLKVMHTLISEFKRDSGVAIA